MTFLLSLKYLQVLNCDIITIFEKKYIYTYQHLWQLAQRSTT